MPKFTTPSQALADSLWSQDQDRAARWIAASNKARLHADAVLTISRCYDFSRNDADCRVSPEGVVTQAAMTLTRRAVPEESLTVLCKLDEETSELLWFVADMRHARFEAAAYIEAVRRRVTLNEAERQGGRN